MREILFRGKRVDNGEIVEGFYIFDGFNHYIVKFYTDENAEGTLYPVQESFEVVPETVGQFTGLTDERGKKISGGDIVRYSERRLGGEDVPVVNVVEFAEGGFAVNNYFLNHWLWNSIYGNTQLSDIEVIGNIHDNPELLEKGGT